MISLRWDSERRHERRHGESTWATFHGRQSGDPLAGGFGALELLTEGLLAPGAAVSRLALDHAEVVTYVVKGTLACSDSSGGSGLLAAGGFRCMPAGAGASHLETNASPTEEAHFFQIWLRHPETGLAPSQDQVRIGAAERRGLLRVIASPDGRGGSLCLRLDASIHSTRLHAGLSVVHRLSAGRRAWLHVVQGEVMVGKLLLTTGDGAGFTSEQAMVIMARAESELLLVDLDATDRPRAA